MVKRDGRWAMGLPARVGLGLLLVHCGDATAPGGTTVEADASVDAAPQGETSTSDAGSSTEAGLDATSDAAVNAPATEGAGSRYFPRYEESEYADGTRTRRFLGFYDRSRNEDCTVQETGPAEYRCLPATTQNQRGGLFKDATCASPVLVRFRGTPAEASYAVLGTCPTRLGKLGAIVTPTQLFTKDGTGACVVSTTAPGAVFVYDQPVALPSTDFGAFVRTDEAASFPEQSSGTRLALRASRFTSTDGAFQSRIPDLVDLARAGARGTPARTSDGKRRLVPQAYGGSDNLAPSFADATCNAALFGFFRPTLCTPDPAQSGDASENLVEQGCPVTRIRNRPTTAPLTRVFVSSGAACTDSTALPANLDVFPASAVAVASESSFAELTESTTTAATTTATSGTALDARAKLTTSADGLRLRDRDVRLVDRATGAECSPATLDGAVRCVPQGPSASLAFEDAACTKQVVRVLADSCRPSGDPASPVLRLVGGAGTGIVKRPAGAPLVLTQVFDKSGASCSAVPVDPGTTVLPAPSLVEIPSGALVVRTRLEIVPKP